MTQPGEEQITALQSNIRGVWATANRILLWAILIPVLLVVPVAVVWFTIVGGLSSIAQGLVTLVCTAFAATIAATVGLLASGPMIGAHIARSRAELRQALAALPRDQQARVLLPMRAERSNASTLARELTHHLQLGSEAIPADAPAGRGDEASAAG